MKLPTLLGNFKSLGFKGKGQKDIVFHPKLANRIPPSGLPMGFSTPKQPDYYDSEEEFTPQEDTEDSKAVLAQLLGDNKPKP